MKLTKSILMRTFIVLNLHQLTESKTQLNKTNRMSNDIANSYQQPSFYDLRQYMQEYSEYSAGYAVRKILFVTGNLIS